MENSFKSLLGQNKSLLIVLPDAPTFDQVASALALFLALSQQEGKEVNIYSPSPMIVEFNRLIGVNKIKTEIGNKNLAITFEDYNPQGIEKVSWDIDNGLFKLTVVPKANVAPPHAEQIQVSYAGVAADLVILVGGTDANSFPVVKTEDLANANLAHIGNRELSVTGRTISSFATVGSSISEVIGKLLKANGYRIDADIATNLLMGIEDGTKEFSTQGVTADTFSMVAFLMRTGGKRLSQGQVQAQDFPAGAIPGMPTKVPTSWTEPKIFKGTSVS